MALRGSLSDVPVVDVLQFIHLSGKSGTLVMTSGVASALVELSEGNIAFARAPTSRTLGSVLVQRGLLSEADLERLLAVQQNAADRPALGHLIVEEGLLSFDVLADCVRDQIHEAMLEIVSWRTGEFQFHQARLDTVDDVRVDIEELLPAVALNTQFFLLEAMRLVDEQVSETLDASSRAGGPHPSGPLPAPRAPSPRPCVELSVAPVDASALQMPSEWAEPTLPPLGKSSPTGVRPRGAGIMPVGLDQPTLEVFAKALATRGYPVLGHVPSRHVAEQFLGARAWPGSMVLLWRVRGGERGNADETLGLLTDTLLAHPGWTVVALVSGSVELVARTYAAGARVVVPVRARGTPSEPLIYAVEAVVERIWRDNSKEADAHAAEMRAWLSATRLTNEMHRAGQRSSVALELMRVAAQVLDRSILFLAKGDSLIGLGAFGRTQSGQPMAEAMRGLALDLKPDTPLARGLADGAAFVGAPSELGLGRVFFELAGAPAIDRAVLIPLVGPSRAIGVLYGDNGNLAHSPRGLHTVELAASQASLAYENAILRRRLDEHSGQS